MARKLLVVMHIHGIQYLLKWPAKLFSELELELEFFYLKVLNTFDTLKHISGDPQVIRLDRV